MFARGKGSPHEKASLVHPPDLQRSTVKFNRVVNVMPGTCDVLIARILHEYSSSLIFAIYLLNISAIDLLSLL